MPWRGKCPSSPVPQGQPFRSGPIPPAPPHSGNCEQEPEIIVPNRTQFARNSDRPSLGSIPPRALLDEAATIAIQQQHVRRDRLLWTLAGTLVAMVLLWTQLKSRTAESTTASEVTLLPAMAAVASGVSGPKSLSEAERLAPTTSKQLAVPAEEAPPIDIDEDESPALSVQSHAQTTPQPVPPEPPTNPANRLMPTARGRDSNSPRDERAKNRSTSTSPATVPNSVAESPPVVPMRRAWFPED